MAVSNQIDNLISRAELSRRLAVHPNTLVRLEKKGIINAIRIGGSIRYDYKSIITILKRNKN